MRPCSYLVPSGEAIRRLRSGSSSTSVVGGPCHFVIQLLSLRLSFFFIVLYVMSPLSSHPCRCHGRYIGFGVGTNRRVKHFPRIAEAFQPSFSPLSNLLGRVTKAKRVFLNLNLILILFPVPPSPKSTSFMISAFRKHSIRSSTA